MENREFPDPGNLQILSRFSRYWKNKVSDNRLLNIVSFEKYIALEI